MPKSKTKPPAKPVVTRPSVGLPLPPICTLEQVQLVAIALKNIIPPHGTVTLRQVEAAVGFLIQEQQWNVR